MLIFSSIEITNSQQLWVFEILGRKKNLANLEAFTSSGISVRQFESNVARSLPVL